MPKMQKLYSFYFYFVAINEPEPTRSSYIFFVFRDFQSLFVLQSVTNFVLFCNTFSFGFKIFGSAWERDLVRNVKFIS